MKRAFVTAALLALTAANTAEAQLVAKKFSVTTRLGTRTSERAASLDPAAMVGLDTEYALNKWFGVGTSIDVARGNTTNEDFLVRLRYGQAASAGGDSIFYQFLGQATNTININTFATVRYPSKRISPFLLGGVGTYALILDPQLNGRSTKINELNYLAGGGVWFRLNDKSGIQFDVRNVIFQDYNRELLNPARERAEQNVPFPEDFKRPPAAKSTVANLTYTLGFRYIPGGGN
jgi:hypothetical protein